MGLQKKGGSGYRVNSFWGLGEIVFGNYRLNSLTVNPLSSFYLFGVKPFGGKGKHKTYRAMQSLQNPNKEIGANKKTTLLIVKNCFVLQAESNLILEVIDFVVKDVLQVLKCLVNW